ncbi:hypothetical protein N3K63_14185 [Microbacterium sp. W1N]|uniref:hypothetical protein n=1 Tax=Microbacterium festucae TaxID=2977531 RepID=UPI0021BE8CD2|nr:hypothetical protein [Microbacterium festucae]MCT9821430.1 hypothetical protein [Microbacterium festucae]
MSTDLDPVEPLEPVGSAAAEPLLAAVLGTDGVAEVFSPHSRMRRLPGLLVPAVGGAEPEVAVVDDGGRPAVAVRIATSSAQSTVDTARRVADRLLAAADDPGATVDVEVARIH